MGVANLRENMIDQQAGVDDSVAESMHSRNSYLDSQDAIDRVNSFYGKNQQTEQVQPEQIVEEDNSIDKNFVAIREELAREKREKEELKANFEIWKTALHKQNIPEPEYRQNPYDQLDSEDAIPKKVYQDKEREWNDKHVQMQRDISELRLAIKYPDYKEVVDEYAAPLIKEKPHLAAGYYSAPDPLQYIYDLGVLARQSKQKSQENAVVKSEPGKNAQKMLNNSKKPGSIALTGGQGSFVHVKDYATMSDEDFENEVMRIQSGF